MKGNWKRGVKKGKVRKVGVDVLVDLLIVVKTRMAIACVQAAGKRDGKFTDKAVVCDAEVSEFQCEAD